MPFLWANCALSFDGPIEIRRACLNPSDSTISLFFNELSNPCATFTRLEIMGREVKMIPDNYILIETLSVLPTNNISIKQANLKRWEYFIKFYYKCDGATLLLSDTIQVDFTPPSAIPLDSVSVDQTTQRIIIGWSENPSPDFMGYLVFEVVGSNNIQLNNQTDEFYVHPASQPTIKSHSYTYNSYDSCGNRSILANAHSTMHLTRRFDICQKELKLSWNAYVGWISEKYYVFESKDGSAYQMVDSTTSLNISIKDLTPGSSYCYYIRSKKAGSNFTSSSNRICFAVPNHSLTKNTHIKSISVTSGNTMKITWFTELGSKSIRAEIYRGEESSNLSKVSDITFINGVNVYFDNINTTEHSYFYRIIMVDSCVQANDSSGISKSVFLEKDNNDLEIKWNSFEFENSNTKEDNILQKGSTWNTITTNAAGTDPTFFLLEPDSPFCYRVVTVSNDDDSSFSNTICFDQDLNAFIPNAIKLTGGSTNNLFTIFGTGIDWENTSIGVFTRWGEKIFDLTEGSRIWDGTYKGKKVPSGIYLYSGQVLGKKKEKKAVKGTILILD